MVILKVKMWLGGGISVLKKKVSEHMVTGASKFLGFSFFIKMMILGYTLTTFRHNYIIHHFVGWLDFPLFNFPFPTFPFVKSLDVYSEVVVNLYTPLCT
jgi:hypothetical protein